MKQAFTVAKQVFFKNIKSWGFYLMVLAPIVFAIIIGLVGYFTAESTSNESVNVAVISEDSGIEEYFSVYENEDDSVEIISDYSEVAEAEQAYNDDEIDGFISVDTTEMGIGATVHHNGELSQYLPEFNQIFSQIQMVNTADQLGLTEEELAQLNAPAAVEEAEIDIPTVGEDGPSDEVDPVLMGIAYLIIFMLFIFVSFYSGMICEEIATEKGSRVMEVVLSSITATQHFFGKLLGLAFTIVVHVSLYIIFGGLTFFGLNQLFEEDILSFITTTIDFETLFSEFLGITLLLSVLAIVMYAVMSAFLGSLATKTEDANKVMLPLILLLVAGFYIGMFSMGTGADNIIIRIGSYLPFWSPLVMPFRMAANSVGTLELWLSIAGIVLFTILVTWLSLMFYRSNVLVYSQENFIKQLKRSWSINKSNRQARNS